MRSDSGKPSIPSVFRQMHENFNGGVSFQTVFDWQKAGVMRVEDGNHGNDRPRSDEFVAEGTPFVRPPNLIAGRVHFSECDHINQVALKRVRKGVGRGGDVLLTHRATVGRMAFVPEDGPQFVTNPGVTVYRVLNDEIFDNRYLYYFMLSSHFQDQLAARTGDNSTFPYVALTQQRKLLVPCPPLPEQRRIAAVLGALDDKIELNRKMNRTLEEMVQALFKSWFIDFDGVPPEDLVASDLGPIPRRWQVGNVRRLAKLELESIKPADSPGTEWEHYSIPAFDDGANPAADHGDSIKSSKYVVPPDAVLVSKLNPQIRRVWMPDVRRADRAICSTEFMPFRPAKAGRAFVYGLFCSEGMQAEICRRATGSTGSRQRVKPREVEAITVVEPSAEALNRFELAARPLHEKRLLNRAQSRTLAELRNTLLPKLISGEIRVPEAEEAAESVA